MRSLLSVIVGSVVLAPIWTRTVPSVLAWPLRAFVPGGESARLDPRLEALGIKLRRCEDGIGAERRKQLRVAVEDPRVLVEVALVIEL